MQISNHYLPYEEKTLIVLTNNEIAKLYQAEEREVEELEVIEMTTDLPENERGSGTPNAAPPRIDDIKKHSRQELYRDLSGRLQKHLKNGFSEVVLCAPEVYKNEILEAMHTDVQSAIKELVSKNLAMLPLDAVIRILHETRGAKE